MNMCCFLVILFKTFHMINICCIYQFSSVAMLCEVVFLLITLLLQAVCSSNVNSLHGIAYVSITTDNLTASTQFYTQVMGGMQVPELAFSFHGDSHYYRMFQKEILDARTQGLDPVQLGIPDIRDNGTHEVQGNFIIFDNGIIKLIEFVQRNTSNAFNLTDQRTSPCYIAAPHICFWVKDDVNFDYYVDQLEQKSHQMGFNKVRVNRPITNGNEADLPKSELGGPAGFSWAYLKGPRDEQLELNQMKSQYRYYLGGNYCKRHGVATAFLNNHPDNQWKKAAGVSGQLYGMFHFGTRTDNLMKSVNFYTRVLGSDLVPEPLQGVDARGDDTEIMLFQKEILDAKSWGVAPRNIGVANISEAGSDRLDYRFGLFDNNAVEMLMYTAGKKLSDPQFNPRYNWSSPAYIHNMRVAFFVDSSIDLNLFIKNLECKASAEGFAQVKANRAVDVSTLGQHVPLNQYSQEFTDGPLKGFNYVFAKGPAGEQLSFVQFRDVAEVKLKSALLRYSAVSTAFEETNPWTYNEYEDFCSKYPPKRGHSFE